MVRHAIKAVLHRPVVDLRLSPAAEFFSNAAAISAAQLLSDTKPYPIWIQRKNPPGFREEVLLETGLDPCATSDALDYLRSCVSERARLPWPLRLKAARTLLQMGEQHQALALLDQQAEPCPQQKLLRISVLVALKRTGHIDQIDARALLDQCQGIVAETMLPHQTRCSAAIMGFLLGLQAAPAAADQQALYDQLLKLEAELGSGHGDFVRTSLRSRIWRAAAMYPHARGQLQRMREEMDRAEALGLAARPSCDTEQFLHRENLFSVYESRVKESIALSDLDGALRFANRLVELFPNNATARIELGEVLLQRHEAIEAAAQYSLAAGYAPPGGALSWFMAGESFALAGEHDRALACYIASFKEDNEAVSAVRQAASRSSGSPAAAALHQWTERTLRSLKSAGGEHVEQ